jgi:hypothetical protein
MSRLLVTQYQTEVKNLIRYGGSRNEASIRRAFENQLNQYCKPRNYMLVPELDYKTKFNTTVRPDGTVKDAIRLRAWLVGSHRCLRYVYPLLSLGDGSIGQKRHHRIHHQSLFHRLENL